MKTSYEEYEIMLIEIREDINDGVLDPAGSVQVQRDNIKVINGYRPIIDWYPDDQTMLQDLKLDPFDTKEEINEKQQMLRLYTLTRPYLETVSVQSMIKELEEGASIMGVV